MTTTTLVLVRHGKTLNNERGILQGHLDDEGCQLTARGREEARLLGASWSSWADGPVFAGVYSSDLGRAMSTTRLCVQEMKGIADADVDSLITKDERLRERYLAALQGRPVSEIRHLSSNADQNNAGIETVEQVATRALTAIEEIAQRHVGAKVLIVAHGGTISILLQHFLGMHPGSPANFRIRNTSCSVVDVRVEGGRVEDVTVQSMGCVAHLEAH